MSDDRRLDTGDVINEFEVTSVSYQANEGVKSNFSYTVRLKSELDTEREAAIEAERKLEEQLKQDKGE